MQTIENIINNVYYLENLPPPKVDQETLRQLLVICTTRTPFRNINGDLYTKCEGVGMGNSFRSTFAEFYMCDLEN